jgi:hypothetical protein
MYDKVLLWTQTILFFKFYSMRPNLMPNIFFHIHSKRPNEEYRPTQQNIQHITMQIH